MGMEVESWMLGACGQGSRQARSDREPGREKGNHPLSFFTLPSLGWRSTHQEATASGASAMKSCHYVWSQLQYTWLWRVIGSGKTLLLFSGLKVHFCPQQISKSLYSREMPLFCLLTYTAHKSLHRRPWPKWEELSRLANCSHKLFKLWTFSERQIWPSILFLVFHSF